MSAPVIPADQPAPKRKRSRWWAVIAAVVVFVLGILLGTSGEKTKTVTTAGPTVTATATVPGPVTTAVVTHRVPGPRTTVTAVRRVRVPVPGSRTTVRVTVTEPAPGGAAGGGDGSAGTLLTTAGNGEGKTQTFTVTADSFTVNYTYDCSAFGASGNFIADLYQGSDEVDGIANELGNGKSASTPLYDGAGTYHIEVDSECAWNLTVTQ